MNAFARIQTRVVQSGHLHLYLLIMLLATIGLVGWSLVRQGNLPVLKGLHDIRLHEWMVVLVVLISVALIVQARSRLLAVVGLGVVGYSAVLIYIMYGAPDLAMTQFSADTLTIILLVLVLYRLPRYRSYSKAVERLRDGAAALVAGGLVTALVLAATAVPMRSRLSPYFAENSYVLAKGRNIVNVILVDFRALDTMGEITVLAVAAIGVYAMLKLKLGKNGDD
jgi:multicomponent Na+:H+ antiporter subunit A